MAFTRQVSAEMERLTIMLPIAFEFYAIAARQFLKEYYREFREALAALIQRGIDHGELRPVDAITAANTILALFEGLNVLWITDPAAIQVNESVEASVLLLLEGLQARASSAITT